LFLDCFFSHLTFFLKSSCSNAKKKKKSKAKVKEAYEKERARQIAMIAMAQEETDKMHSPKKKPALAVMDDNAPKFNMASTKSPRNKDTNILRNDSNASSLEYSIDSSMLGDSSIITHVLKQDDESQTSEVGVPSDEELFAVGWAKALDPKSGSYYYFTLDRSKIVWDNPLEGAYTEASSIPA
jgi:hypothetical protein